MPESGSSRNARSAGVERHHSANDARSAGSENVSATPTTRKPSGESAICHAPKCRHVGRRVIIAVDGDDNTELVLCEEHLAIVRVLQSWLPSRSRGVSAERLLAIRFDN